MCVFFPASRLLWRSTSKKVKKCRHTCFSIVLIRPQTLNAQQGDEKKEMWQCVCVFVWVYDCVWQQFPVSPRGLSLMWSVYMSVCVCSHIKCRIWKPFLLMYNPHTQTHKFFSRYLHSVTSFWERERNTGLISYINVNNKWPISLNKGVTSVKMAETLFP